MFTSFSSPLCLAAASCVTCTLLIASSIAASGWEKVVMVTVVVSDLFYSPTREKEKKLAHCRNGKKLQGAVPTPLSCVGQRSHSVPIAGALDLDCFLV
jgi:hypothetical protein